MNEEQLKKMEVGDEDWYNDEVTNIQTGILRVVGGWIYAFNNGVEAGSIITSSVFVPEEKE